MLSAFQPSAFQNDAFQIESGGVTPPVVSDTTQPQHAGRSKRPQRRQYRQLVVRINGEFIEVDSVDQLMELLRETKKEIPAVAKAKVAEVIKRGERLSTIKVEEARSIELVQAPDFAKAMIETRIREMEIMYWEAVEKAMKRVIDEEDEEMLLNG